MSVTDRTELEIKRVLVAIALMVVGTEISAAQSASSLTETQIESTEARATLEALLRENGELKKKLQISEASLLALQKNLAATNSEAEVLKRKVSQLMLRFEALGLDAVSDSGKLEQRLLKAASDLRIVEDERTALRSALLDLTEAVIRYQKVAVTADGDARQALEGTVRAASKILGNEADKSIEPTAVAPSLGEGLVIAVKQDLALIVSNLGRRQGVKVGMPFEVMRNKSTIGTVRVVEVRETISGAVIQDLNSEDQKIKVGDQLRVGAVR